MGKRETHLLKVCQLQHKATFTFWHAVVNDLALPQLVNISESMSAEQFQQYWVTRFIWCTWGSKADLCGWIQQTSCWKAESGNSDNVSIRTGPRSNGRSWLGLMDHAFFCITWMVRVMCLCVCRLPPENLARDAGGGIVTLLAMFCRDTSGPAVLPCACYFDMYLSIVAEPTTN